MIGVGFNSHEILTSCSGMTMDDRDRIRRNIIATQKKKNSYIKAEMP
jgi:hypothetical protein